MLQECIQLISVLLHRNLVILMMMPVNWMICSHRVAILLQVALLIWVVNLEQALLQISVHTLMRLFQCLH